MKNKEAAEKLGALHPKITFKPTDVAQQRTLMKKPAKKATGGAAKKKPATAPELVPALIPPTTSAPASSPVAVIRAARDLVRLVGSVAAAREVLEALEG